MYKFFPDNSDKICSANGTFKQRKTLATRKEEVENIRVKFPTKIPVIVERYYKESQLPLLDKTKFLVPQELTVSQFLTIIRNRMHLGPNQAFYLLINNRSIASMSKTVAEVYLESKDDDGFLYVTYASQEMFGSLSPEDLKLMCGRKVICRHGSCTNQY